MVYSAIDLSLVAPIALFYLRFASVNSYYSGRPTVFPARDFNASADSQVLYKAMKGLGKIIQNVEHCKLLSGSGPERA